MTAKRWLVTGASGQVGAELVSFLRSQSVIVAALSRRDLDVTDEGAVRATLARERPDVVVNAAAFTNVDAAESEPARAALVNAVAPGLLAAAASIEGAAFVHLSTDYVFSGRDAADRPYDEADPTDPVNVYGLTKRAGELAALAAAPDAYVVRTSWVYGAHGPNFVRSIRHAVAHNSTVEVVDDQVGTPTWARDLVAGVVELVSRGAAPGIYHATAGGSTSRYGQARAIAALTGIDPLRIRPVATTDAPPRAAVRPAWSVLGHRRWEEADLTPLPAWDVALAAALRDPRMA